MLPAAAWRARLALSSRLLNSKLRGAECKESASVHPALNTKVRIWALAYLSVVRDELGRASAIAEMPLMSNTKSRNIGGNQTRLGFEPPIEFIDMLCAGARGVRLFTGPRQDSECEGSGILELLDLRAGEHGRHCYAALNAEPVGSEAAGCRKSACQCALDVSGASWQGRT